MDAKRGEIVDYEVKDAAGNVTDTFPMLVIHVNDQEGGDRSVVGYLFTTDGPNLVTVPGETPEDAPEKVAEKSFDQLSEDERRTFFRQELSKLSDSDRAGLRSALGTDPETTVTPAATPPAPPSDPSLADPGTSQPNQ